MYLGSIIEDYGIWTYVFLFLVIYSETGFVVTNFLPGDVLLFTAGAFAALGSLDIGVLIVLPIIAAMLGDNTSFWIGRLVGVKEFRKGSYLYYYKRYLDRTRELFDNYGSKTIIFARFVPLLRSLAPFVAGMSLMRYKRFGMYNFIGVFFWNLIFVLGGYFFGKLPVVKNNLSIFIFALIFILVLYNLIRFLCQNRKELSSYFSL